MRYDRYNSEGYKDLTAYHAFKNIEKQRKAELRPTKKLLNRFGNMRRIVYICSPYTGDIQGNVLHARRYCSFAVAQEAIPIAPHLFFPQFMDDGDPVQRDLAMFMNLNLMLKCKELWVFGSVISPGMQQEILYAKHQNMRIRYFNTDCQEVLNHA